MKNKIRELTDRNNGMSNAKREEKYQQFVRGWVNYFKLADMKKLLKEIDEWARRRIRMVYWKQWKKIKTKYRMLKALGLEHWKAKEIACSRKGYWRMAKVLNQIFSNKIIAKLGYTSMLDYYLTVCENQRTAVYRTVRTVAQNFMILTQHTCFSNKIARSLDFIEFSRTFFCKVAEWITFQPVQQPQLQNRLHVFPYLHLSRNVRKI